MTELNKFNKTVTQFYLEPISSNSLTKIAQPSFIHHGRRFRTKKVLEINKKIHERKQRSLINFDSLSKVFEAQQKVFRSSSSFYNPEQACINQTNKRSCLLLKSHILQKDFQTARTLRDHQKLKDKSRYENELVSNYGYFTEAFEEKKKGTLQIKRNLPFRYSTSRWK